RSAVTQHPGGLEDRDHARATLHDRGDDGNVRLKLRIEPEFANGLRLCSSRRHYPRPRVDPEKASGGRAAKRTG
ncbi:MAG: hypothetical protein ACREX9_09985, partial [Gammaproteobacteria bacterium]